MAHTAQRIPVNISPRALVPEETSADSHKSLDSKPGGKGNKGKKTNSERDRCKKCGKIKTPPHWAKSCLENSSSSAQAVFTPTPVSSPPEVAPPGLSTPVNSSANSENVVTLAAISEKCLVSRWIF